MITLRRIERLVNERQYQRLFTELMSARPEGGLHLTLRLPAAATAIALLRLEELSQTQTTVYSQLLRVLLSQQQADGGFGDPATTALCVRALFACDGFGAAVDAGLTYLANLQKQEGIWPAEPLRRLPADPAASVFILYQLASFPAFRSAVRFFDAVNWFDQHESQLDDAVRRLWNHAALRCQQTLFVN
jgi:hypothetical protein